MIKEEDFLTESGSNFRWILSRILLSIILTGLTIYFFGNFELIKVLVNFIIMFLISHLWFSDKIKIID